MQHQSISGTTTSRENAFWGHEEELWVRQANLFGYEQEEKWSDSAVAKIHERLLLRELEDLRNGEVSDRVKFGIWVWILDPLVNDSDDADEPFTFRACCEHAGYSAVSLIKSLITSRKAEVDRLFRPGAAQALWERADELDEPADHCLARAMSTREPGVYHA